MKFSNFYGKILAAQNDIYMAFINFKGWAKQIPGFSSLPLNDQMRLLQSTWAEILTFSLAWRSIPNCGKLRFAQDFTLDERLARECHCLELYTHVRKDITIFKHFSMQCADLIF